jgi:hypothetical protein
MTSRLRLLAHPLLGSLTGGGLATVAVVAVAVVVGCSTSSSPPVAASRCHGRPTAPAGSPGPAIRRLRALGSAPTPIGAAPLLPGFGAVWAPSSAGLVKLSVPSGKPTIAVRMPIDDIAVTSSCVYGLSQARNKLLEVDPGSLRVTRQWTLNRGSHSIAATDAAVYVAYDSGTTGVERVDLASGTVTQATIHSASGMAADQAIAAGAGSVWEIDGTSLYRLDPARLSLSRTTSLVASDIWFGDGSLWAASETPNGGVERIDPQNDRVEARSQADAIQIAFSPGVAWLSAAAGPTAVSSVTARTLAALPTSSVASSGSAGIAVVGDEIWTTYSDLQRLQRIAPAEN